MKFPVKFTRYVGTAPSGGKALGSDVLLVDANGAPRKPGVNLDDNFLPSRIISMNGWPLERVALVAKYTGAGAPVALPVTMYVFEDQLEMYFPIAASAANITPGKATAPTAPLFFDAMTLIDFPNTMNDSQAVQPGTPSFLCIIGAGVSSPNGQYDFILGAELTSNPL